MSFFRDSVEMEATKGLSRGCEKAKMQNCAKGLLTFLTTEMDKAHCKNNEQL